MAVSGHIIFHFKMNLILVETFVEKYMVYQKNANEKRKKTDLLNFS